MELKVIQNLSEDELLSRLSRFATKYLDRKPGKEVALETILKECAASWASPPSSFLGKINHNNNLEKAQKTTLITGCFLYTNFDKAEIQKFLQSKFNMHYWDAAGLVAGWTKHNECLKDPIVSFFNRLEKLRPGHLRKLTDIDLSFINELRNWPHRLTAYQISRIPVRDIEWFEKSSKKDNFLLYSVDGRFSKWLYWGSDLSLICSIQSQGFKVIAYEEHSRFSKCHPICDRCIHRINCDSADIGAFGGSTKYFKSSVEFECFETLPEEPLKVDIELLYPLDKLQQQ